jgi:hypothetical protein
MGLDNGEGRKGGEKGREKGRRREERGEGKEVRGVYNDH